MILRVGEEPQMLLEGNIQASIHHIVVLTDVDDRSSVVDETICTSNAEVASDVIFQIYGSSKSRFFEESLWRALVYSRCGEFPVVTDFAFET